MLVTPDEQLNSKQFNLFIAFLRHHIQQLHTLKTDRFLAHPVYT